MQPLSILVYAYVFPPDAGSGTFRTLYFANRWARTGDAVTVITVRETDFEATATVDTDLCGTIETGIKVVRTRAYRPLDRLISIRAIFSGKRSLAVPQSSTIAESSVQPSPRPQATLWRRLLDLVSAVLTFPDQHSGWILGAVLKGRKLARQQHFDCIYASGGPWSGLAAATLLHRLTGIPLVLDFRDPWGSSPNFKEGDPWLRRMHERLEGFCVRRAQRIITNTEELRSDFILRYPSLGQQRFVCVTNGFEELMPVESPPGRRCFTLVHAGALYLSRNPLHFLQAYAELLEEKHIAREHAHLCFIGGLPIENPAIAAVLQRLGTTIEVLPRLPHAQALQLQCSASALLLFQPGLPLQVPRKLYEYLSLRLPILAITEPTSATAHILADLQIHYTAADEVEPIKRVLLQLYRDWIDGTVSGAPEDRLQKYSNHHLADKLRREMLEAATST